MVNPDYYAREARTRPDQPRGIQNIAQGLIEKIGRTDIVLFLGAGVNEGRIPTWGRLLDAVVEHAVQYALNESWSAQNRSDLISWLGGRQEMRFGSEERLTRVITESARVLGRGTLTLSDESIKRLAHSMIEMADRHPRPPSFYERATLAKQLLGKQYLHVVHQKLYECVEQPFPQTAPFGDSNAGTSFLGAIAKLCQNPQVCAVVTYNYDDFLECLMGTERACNAQLRKPASLCSQRLAPIGRNVLPVYHVHGLLPREGLSAEPDDSTFVFCYEEYYRALLQPCNWQTAHQLYFLRSCACLFLGVSLDDMNMLRVLSHAREYAAGPGVFVLWCDRDMRLTESGTAVDRNGIIAVRQSLCREFGAELVLCGRDYPDVHGVVGSLADLARKGHATETGKALGET
jgi:hypothetical protein